MKGWHFIAHDLEHWEEYVKTEAAREIESLSPLLTAWMNFYRAHPE